MAEQRHVAWIAVFVLVGIFGCSSDDGRADKGWARGTVTIDGDSYDVERISMELEFGEDGYYSISGDPVEGADEDCVPGLSGGLVFYGPVPGAAARPEDLAGKRVRLEFSGDGDDANLCFLGTEGLLGADEAWVEFDSIDGDRVGFTMRGRFTRYDGEGGYSRQPLTASARGTAKITEIWN